MPDHIDAASSGAFGPGSVVIVAVLFVLVVVLAAYLLSRFRVVHGQRAFVVERLGVPRPHALKPGLHFIPPLHAVRHRINLEQIQVERQSQVKTADDAFIIIQWVVRFSVRPTDEAILAYAYKVEKPVDQLVWRVENELRQIIHSMTLQQLYDQKDTISRKIIADQAGNALETGLQIDDVVIEQPMPPKDVQDAMNNQIAALARQKAAAAEAEAERLRRVGLARAESESKELQGQGIARQRRAIAQGFKDSFDLMQQGMPEATAQDVLALMQKTIEADMISTAAATGKSTIVFVPTGMVTPGQTANLLPLVTKDTP